MVPQGIAFTQTFMVSSTMNDLHAERMAAYNAIQARGQVAWISENPPWKPTPSMQSLCTDMAARCDYFILILGPRYGFAPPGHFASDELSVTELEYLAASADDPSKILVCLQHAALDTSNERQWRFIHEVLQHYDGRSVLRFKTADDLRRQLKVRLPRHPVASPAEDILAYTRALERGLALPPAAIQLVSTPT